MATITLPHHSARPVAIDHEPVTLRRALLTGVGISTLVMLLGPGILLWLHTGDIWHGVGLGAFCAAWGGPGFGVMLGISAWSTAHGH